MQHVNTGFYYDSNTLSSVSYHDKDNREKRISIDSKEVSRGDAERIVSPLFSLSFLLYIYTLDITFGKRWSPSRDVLHLCVHKTTYLFYSKYIKKYSEKESEVVFQK